MTHKTYTIFSSDPTSRDFVMSDDQGNTVEGIVDYVVRGAAREMTTIEVTIIAPTVNIKGNLTEVSFQCPGCDFCVMHSCNGTGS